MKVTYFYFILFLILMAAKSYGQSPVDSIAINATLKGYEFYYHNEKIKSGEVSTIMEPNFEAFDMFESSREAYFFGNVFAILGTGLIIYPFVTSAAGYDPNWGYAFTGVGFIGISIPIFHSYHKKTEAAVRLYNMGLHENKPLGTSLNIGFSTSGLGITYRF